MSDQHLQRRFKINLLFLFLIFVTSTTALANEKNCPIDLDFYQTIEGKRSFGETEFLSQNHNIGLYRGGPVQLKPWISISDQATIGVDANGNIVQLLEFIDQHGQKRQVAAFLSSGIQMKSVFLTSQGQLFAIDSRGELYFFDPTIWRSKKTAESFARVRRSWTISTCALNAVAVLATALHAAVTADFQPAYMIASTMGTIGLTMTHLTLAARKFELANDNTNGFVATGVTLNSRVKNISYLWSEDRSKIHDFELVLESREKTLLSEGIKQIAPDLTTQIATHDFDLKCEHLLLARGVADRTGDHWINKK
jgi:hypothetical protein